MNGPESNYAAWLEKADNDWLNIENNLASKRVPWDTICFHAQQAAEKGLKAYLLFHGRTPSRTHDLVALLACRVEIDPDLAELEDPCRALTIFAVGSRYPDDLFEPTEGDGREMIEAAKAIRAVTLKKLGR